MGCTGNEILDLYVDGNKLNYPLKVEGCSGITRRFSCITNLIEPTYKWTLDMIYEAGGLLLSTKDSCDYTFDDKTHKLYCHARSEKQNCGVVKIIQVIGKLCNVNCPVECILEYADIPAGNLTQLVDTKGKTYSLNQIVECNKLSKNNLKTSEAIKQKLLNAANCKSTILSVSLQSNIGSSNCIRLQINNSPIRLAYVKVGNLFYPFNQANC